MDLEELDSLIRIEMSSDGLSATLHLEPGIEAEVLTDQLLVNLVQSRGVEVTKEVQERLTWLAASYRESPEGGATGVIAEGSAPVHGEDGRFEFEPHLNPESPGAADADEDEAVDHYQRRVIRPVRAGERIGRIIAPTPAEDGRDVTGKTIPAREGKPLLIRDDESIRKEADGSVVAVVGGAIEFKAPALRIVDHVEIAGYVDFSTGHVDFCGDVRIDKGVRDCFHVRADRDILVRGLVEAASIDAARDVTLEGGMAGREKGSLRAGRDARARYLDGTRVGVGRDLIVEKEVVNCQIEVGHSFTSENGVVTGGVLVTADACVVSQLGGESGVTTLVVLGRIEELERLAAEAEELIPILAKEAERAEEKLEQVRKAMGRVTPWQSEELTALERAAQAARSKMEPLVGACAHLREIIAANTTVDLLVQKRLQPGVRLYVGTQVAEITQAVKGPVRILLDGKELVIRDERSGTKTPLSKFARVQEYGRYVGPVLHRIRTEPAQAA